MVKKVVWKRRDQDQQSTNVGKSQEKIQTNAPQQVQDQKSKPLDVPKQIDSKSLDVPKEIDSKSHHHLDVPVEAKNSDTQSKSRHRSPSNRAHRSKSRSKSRGKSRSKSRHRSKSPQPKSGEGEVKPAKTAQEERLGKLIAAHEWDSVATEIRKSASQAWGPSLATLRSALALQSDPVEAGILFLETQLDIKLSSAKRDIKNNGGEQRKGNTGGSDPGKSNKIPVKQFVTVLTGPSAPSTSPSAATFISPPKHSQTYRARVLALHPLCDGTCMAQLVNAFQITPSNAEISEFIMPRLARKEYKEVADYLIDIDRANVVDPREYLLPLAETQAGLALDYAAKNSNSAILLEVLRYVGNGNPNVALKYARQKGIDVHKSLPTVVSNQRRRVLHWLVKDCKAKEYASDVCDSPDLKRVCLKELLKRAARTTEEGAKERQIHESAFLTLVQEWHMQAEYRDQIKHLSVKKYPPADEDKYLVVEIPPISIIDTDEKVEKAREVLNKASMIGLDAEMHPTFFGGSDEACLLQIASRDAVFLFDLLKFSPAMNALFTELFQDPNLYKLGYAWKDDMRVLGRALPKATAFANIINLDDLDDRKVPIPEGFVSVVEPRKRKGGQKPKDKDKEKEKEKKNDGDIDELDSQVQTSAEKEEGDEAEAAGAGEGEGGEQGKEGKKKVEYVRGLSKLSEIVLGKPLDKTYQVSAWRRRPLNPAQVTYAALDAYCLLLLADKLPAKPVAQGGKKKEKGDKENAQSAS